MMCGLAMQWAPEGWNDDRQLEVTNSLPGTEKCLAERSKEARGYRNSRGKILNSEQGLIFHRLIFRGGNGISGLELFGPRWNYSGLEFGVTHRPYPQGPGEFLHLLFNSFLLQLFRCCVFGFVTA